MSQPTTDLVTLLHKRGTVLVRIIESPTPPTTLIEDVSISRATVYRTLDTFEEWGLITTDADYLEPTLFGQLVWTVYDEFVADVTVLVDHEAGNTPLWHTADERTEALGLVADRLDFLESAQTPREKRTLAAELSSARSTVDRVVRKLEVVGLIQRTADGYTTTPIGQQLTARYRPLLAILTDLLAARDLLARLPPDCAFPPAVCVDAMVEHADSTPPYHLPAGVRTRIETADRVRLVLPTLGSPLLLDCCHRGVVQDGQPFEILTSPELFETLTTEFPGPLADMASGACTVVITDDVSEALPPFGLVLAETETTTTVSIVTYGDQGTIQGTIHNETADTVQWAEACYAQAREETRDVTDTLAALTSGQERSATVRVSGGSTTDHVALEAEGVIQLTPEYFTQRAPAPPATGWRTGFDLIDVHAGYAIDRETECDGTRHNLTTDLTARLTESTNVAVLGPPGSGKSTVCKSVACRWYEQGLGPVFYRESGTGTTFTSPAVLEDHLRATEGHALIVVEDAVRAEANAIFRVMQAFRGTQTVTFLLDAREREWADPEAFPTDAGLDAYRIETTETVTVPALDETERERFVRQFEQTTDGDRGGMTAQVLQESSEDPDAQTQDASEPAEVLLLLHRLSLQADPLTVYTTNIPTVLTEDVQHTYAALEEAGDLVLNVGVFVNLLNAAGLDVSPPLVCALATDGEETDIEAVRAALSMLEGRVIFERERGAGAASYRTVHEVWSALFLDHLLEVDSEYAASQRFGRCVTALLSLADEPARRDRLLAAFMQSAPAIERITAAPGEWADTIVEQLFGLGRRRRGLGPLFGTTGDSCIDLPDVCSQTITVKCTLWRANMAREAGDLDRAEHEYEAVSTFAQDVEATNPEWAATLRGRRLHGLGRVAKNRGELDTAEKYHTRALTPYREAGDTQYLARTRANLGVIAHARGNLEAAKTQYRQSLETFHERGDISLKAKTLFNLAVVLGVSDELEAAIEHFQQGLDLYRECGDQRGEARCLALLGEAIGHRGDLTAAEGYCKQALEISRELGIRDCEAHSLAALGRISRMQGNLDTAKTYCQRSLHIRRDIGKKAGEALALTALGEIAAARGTFDIAEEHCTTSHSICRKIGDQNGEADSLATLGNIARKRGDLDTATEHIRASLTLHRENGNSAEATISQRLLGQIACAREQFSTAEDHLTHALTSFRDMGYRYEEAKTLAAFGVLARQRDEPAAARGWFEEAFDLFREMDAIRDTIETTEQFAAVCLTLGDRETAHDYCGTAHDLAQETEFIDVSVSLDERWEQLDTTPATDG